MNRLFITAIQRGGKYLLEQKKPDGLIGNNANVFCKTPLALQVAGLEEEAQDQMSNIFSRVFENGVVKREYLLSHWDLNFISYYLGWLTLAVTILHQSKEKQILKNWMLKYQDSRFGGFFSIYRPWKRRVMHAVHTSVCGIACIRLGDIERAVAAGDFIVNLIDLQTNPDRFYYRVNNNGELITDYPIDSRKTFTQRYGVIGWSLLLLAKLHHVTGNSLYLEKAESLFRFGMKCRGLLRRVSSAPFAWGVSSLFKESQEPDHKSTAEAIARLLLRDQRGDGSWTLGWLIDQIEFPFSVTDCLKDFLHTATCNLDRTAEIMICLSGIVGTLNPELKYPHV